MLQRNNEILVNIDDVGRMVIPKKFRDILGINPNSFINMSVVDGYIKITNNGIKDYLYYIYNIFAKLWCQHNVDATILITNMNEIVYASGVKSKYYKNKNLNKELFKEIRGNYFSFDTFHNELLFYTEERYDYSVISLSHKYGNIGFVILLDNNISRKQLAFIFDFLNKLINDM